MPLEDIVRNWANKDVRRAGIVARQSSFVKFMARSVYDEFEPARFRESDFMGRLDAWLDNENDLERATDLLFLSTNIFFVSRDDFNALYKAAINEKFYPWLINEKNYFLDDEGLHEKLSSDSKKTWFCPISDSMKINSFLHVNGLPGQQFRPDWRSLKCMGDVGRIGDFIERNGIERVVLLEDFVGSGVQAGNIIPFLANFPGIRFLIIPLVCCEEGLEILENRAGSAGNVEVSPVLVIPKKENVSPASHPDESNGISKARNLCTLYSSRLGLPYVQQQSSRDYGMLGFGNVGALVVLYSNCPNNTLALIHHKCESWSPLFPRISRG